MIKLKEFTNKEEMLRFMNRRRSEIVSVCQDNSNIYTVFYWEN